MSFQPRSAAVDRFWADFCAASGTDPGTPFVVDRFGDSADLADQLLDLVLTGPKRATAGLLLDYEHAGDPVPTVGLLTILLDGAGAPRAVIRTSWVDTRPYRAVDAAFAWDEGEGDRTLASWRKNHRAYFTRRCAALGVPFTESMAVVLERFDLVWPPA